MVMREVRGGASVQDVIDESVEPVRKERLSEPVEQRKAPAPRGSKRSKNDATDEGIESGRQVVRLLNILRALESAPDGLTVRELMDDVQLGCGMRQVYRNLHHLEAAGFPLVKEGTRWRVDGP